MNNDARRVTTVVLSISIFLAAFVAFNGSEVRLLISMLAYAVLSAIIILMINGLKFSEFALIGEDFGLDVIIGIVVGVAFIFLNQLSSVIALGAPSQLISLGDAGKFIAVVLVAPVVEEAAFRGWLYPLLYNAFGQRNYVALPLQAIVFGLYHFAVYGGFLGLLNAPGLFIGASFFGLVAGFMVLNKKPLEDITTLERPIVSHMIFNAWLLNMALQVVSIS